MYAASLAGCSFTDSQRCEASMRICCMVWEFKKHLDMIILSTLHVLCGSVLSCKWERTLEKVAGMD